MSPDDGDVDWFESSSFGSKPRAYAIDLWFAHGLASCSFGAPSVTTAYARLRRRFSTSLKNCTVIERLGTTRLVGGLARLDGKPVVIVGHQKGRDTAQKIHRNFAMPRPEGYRKALRLMELAERFQMPLLTFIDTPGAYPGMDAEERGQSEAIARNLLVMAGLKTPIVCTVIGEGGSGGALAIGVGDHVQMMEYATYAVISPEGCASILWKSAEKAELAAQAMGITAKRLEELGLVDQLIEEPLGGAHRDPQAAASTLHDALTENVERLIAMPTEELLQRRHERLRSYGNLA